MDFNGIAEQVFLMTDARRQMHELDMREASAEPLSGYKAFSVMGRPFDPTQPKAYLDGFAIKRV
jgi:nitrate/nitrite transport system substrate-binding protein